MRRGGSLSLGLGGRRPLIALCVGSSLVEAVALLLVHSAGDLGLAGQAGAPVPFGVFHDLRWLVVYHNSWAGLVVEGAGLLLARSVLTALTISAAWPAGAPRPGFGALLVRAVGFTLAAALVLAPCVVLLFGLAVVSVSWLFLVAVPTALVLALLVHHGAIAPGWWRRSPAPRALGWLLLTFLVLTAVAAMADRLPVGAGIALAALTGVFNARAWLGLVAAVTGQARVGRFLPVAPLGLIGMAGIVVGGTVAGFALARTPNIARPAGAESISGLDRAASAGPGAAAPRLPVLVATGYRTHWDGTTQPDLPGPFVLRRFSYRGLSAAGAPLAYDAADTDKSLPDLERLMAEQVRSLHAATRRPVSIVAESEGSLVAKAYLAATPGAPIRALVMVSPLVDPARVYYPPSGVPGWGLAGGIGMEGMSDALSAVTQVQLAPSGPFLRSVVQEAPLLSPLFSCPLPGVRQFAFLPLADAVAAPGKVPSGIPVAVLPAFHGGMLGNPGVEPAIAAVLEGRPLEQTPGWYLADQLIGQAASAWQVPRLDSGLNPVWGPGAKAGPGGLSCGAIRAALEHQITEH